METFLTHPFDEFRIGRRRATWIAAGITLLLHLLMVLVIPERVMPLQHPTGTDEPVVYEIDLVEPQEMRYVEANPDAPENEPDRSDQYSFRAQQAADESPLTDPANQPAVDGEVDSMKIVPGQQQQAEPLPPGLYSPNVRPGEGEGTEGGQPGAQVLPQVTPPQPQPVPDFMQQKPLATEGPGSRLEPPVEPPVDAAAVAPVEPIQVYRPPQAVTAEVQTGDGNGGAAQARPMPRTRPRLAPELITGPLLQSEGSARLRGALALDATFSEFGEYEQQFYAAIQAGWYQEIDFFQPIDTAARVQVRFRIQADGTVDQVKAVQSNASKIATVICETAITKRSPFRPWTQEMVQVFGQERWIHVVFHYR